MLLDAKRDRMKLYWYDVTEKAMPGIYQSRRRERQIQESEAGGQGAANMLSISYQQKNPAWIINPVNLASSHKISNPPLLPGSHQVRCAGNVFEMDIPGKATSVCQEGKDHVTRRRVENSEHCTWRKVLGSKTEEAARDQILCGVALLFLSAIYSVQNGNGDCLVLNR